MIAPTSKYLLSAALVSLLGGCALAPQYTQPTLPVADALPGMKLGVKGDSSLPTVGSELGWREFFVDSRLQSIIQTALANNRDLRVSALNIASYQAQYRIQRSALFPSLSGSGSGTKQRAYSGGNHVTAETYSASVGISSYELDFFGRVRSLKDQALENYLAMEETHRSAQISLVAEIAGAYLTWLADKELLTITEETMQTEEESYQLILQRSQQGMGTQLDLAQARTSLETARANAAMYQRQVAQDINNLSFLAGGPLPGLDNPKHGLMAQVAPTAPPPISPQLFCCSVLTFRQRNIASRAPMLRSVPPGLLFFPVSA